MINQVFNEDCLETMKRMDDNSVDLLIVDPPYYEVKGDFDFIWNDFDEFLKWIELLALQFKRILSDNGSLYLYGHAKKIAYKQIIFDKYFNLENHIVWEKTVCQTKMGIDNFRSYAPIKEHILFYSKEINETGLQAINNDNSLYIPIRDYFKEQREYIKHISYEEINKMCFGTASNGGGMASNILTSYKKGWSFPTKELYEKLQKLDICKKPYEILRQEYEILRQEYEILRRPFDNSYRLEDVMKFDQEATITGKYNHPTQKPPKLSRALISTSTRDDSLVYIPFGGSGVELEVCKELGLDYIGSELDKDYYEIILKRLSKVQGALF